MSVAGTHGARNPDDNMRTRGAIADVRSGLR
jgi:hypothetical protein